MHLNLSQKSILFNILLVSITALTITFVVYRAGTSILVTHALEDLSKQVEREDIILANHVKNIESDVRFLSGTPPIKGFFRAKHSGFDTQGNSSEKQWKDRLAIIFSTLMGSKSGYLQLRLLDKNGNEVVRVDRTNSEILRISDSQLQNKANTDYVKPTLKLKSGATYLSKINLNRDHGEITKPYTPVLRAATPIYDGSKLLGMLIINLDFGQILDRIESTFKKYNQSIYITNDQGSFLIHPVRNKRFSFELGHRHRIQESYPGLASLFLAANTDNSRVIIPENQSDEAIVSRKIYFDSLNKDRFMAIALTQPYSSIVAAESTTLIEIGKIILVLISIFIVLGYFFSRLISKPLQNITSTITAFGSTHTYSPPTSILSRRDEIGILARAFHELVDTVTSTQTSLRDLNANLEDEIDKRSAELHKSEQRWQFALEGSQQGVWDWNIPQSTVFFSKQWKSMLGYAEHEIDDTFEEWQKRVHPDDMPQVMQDIENHFSGQTSVYENEHRVLCKDDSYKWILDRGMVVERDENNMPLRMIGTHTDITERKRIDKMKNEFISTVSHELRTPLTSIRGSLGLITGGAVGEMSEQAASLLSIAHKNTERLLLLINDILDLQKIEAGNMPFDFKDTQLDAFITDAIKSNQPFAEAHEVSLELHNHTNSATLLIADSDRLLQVMNNLLSNAAKFSPSTSKIIVDVSSNDSEIVIAVTDQGPGIPEEFRDKLFEKFTQSDSSDTRNIGGTGLGLSIAKLIIEKHNGSIDYKTVMGKGTTFYIHLPYLHSTKTKNESFNQVAISGKDILIIEDDPDIATLLSLQLKNANYQPQIANSAEQAWELLHTQKFDAITLDIVLPGQDGISFIKKLRQHEEYYDLPIIVISVKADAAKKELNGGAVGVIDWLTKPFNHTELKRILKQTIKINSKPNILYVEDDPDIQQVVKQVLSDQAQLTLASTYKEAKQLINDDTFDLVLLDVSLPDGNGLDLLVDIDNCSNKPQVVIFSANPVSTDDAERVSAVLIKSQTTNDELINMLIKLTAA